MNLSKSFTVDILHVIMDKAPLSQDARDTFGFDGLNRVNERHRMFQHHKLWAHI